MVTIQSIGSLNMNENKIYLTTGEFAKLCHTSKHTLFHYCNIGLFVPSYTDENGYRYYHVLQYDTFLTITQLKTMGMSLSDIKSYLGERSPHRMLDLYSNQEKLLTDQIKRLTKIKKEVRSQKAYIEQALHYSDEIFSEDLPEKHLLCSDEILEVNNSEMTATFGELIYRSVDKKSTNILGMVYHLQDAQNNDTCPWRFFVYTHSFDKQNGITKPAATYLTTYHHGSYETINETHLKLISYAKSHCLNLGEWVYDETVIGDWAVS